MRLGRSHALTDSLGANNELIDDELARIRQHPLYGAIKDKMMDHLRTVGYERVPLHDKQDFRFLMLSTESEGALNTFIHSLRVTFPHPNEKVAALLDNNESMLGTCFVKDRIGRRYDTACTYLIQLLFEFPDDLKDVANSIGFRLSPAADIARRPMRQCAGSQIVSRWIPMELIITAGAKQLKLAPVAS